MKFKAKFSFFCLIYLIFISFNGPAISSSRTDDLSDRDKTFGQLGSLLPLDPKAGLPKEWPVDGICVFPEAARGPWLQAIGSATQSIQMAAYRLSDPEIIQALGKALGRNVKVTLLVEPEPISHDRSDNVASPIEELKKMGASVHNPPDHAKYVHHKLIIIDGKWAMIGTGNLDKESFDGIPSKDPAPRDFTITVTRPDLLTELSAVFQADTLNQKLTPTNPQLVWGPDNQRAIFLKMIRNAKSSIKIYQQSIQDEEIAKALVEAAHRKVRVEIVMTPDPFGLTKKGKQDPNQPNQELITTAGGFVYLAPKNTYIHTKVMIIDGEDDRNRLMYIGSCNFYTPSLDQTRELGVLTTDASQIGKMLAIHGGDMKSSTVLQVTSVQKK